MRGCHRAAFAFGFGLSLCVLGQAAAAASFVYQSQNGRYGAGGSAPALGSDTDGGTISGLTGVDGQASVAAGSPPNYYSASVEIQTTLDPTRLRVAGEARAAAGPSADEVDYDPTLMGFASASAEVSILFDLEEPAPIRMRPSSDWDAQYAALKFLDLAPGFEIRWDYNGFWWLPCAPNEPLCGELEKMVGAVGGGILPAGHYELAFRFAAYAPVSVPCAAGCGSAGGAMTIEIVPEPSPAALLAAGLALLATRRKQRGHRTAAGILANVHSPFRENLEG